MSQSSHPGILAKKGNIIESANQLMRIYVQVNAIPKKATYAPHQTNFGLDIKAHQGHEGQHPNQRIPRYLDSAIASAKTQNKI